MNTEFIKDESGFIDLRGIEYPIFAGLGAIMGVVFCAMVLFPLSFVWPSVWDAAFWVVGGCTIAGLIFASQID